MIVIISGKAINPEHVATVIPYGNECDVTVTMSHGKNLNLPVLKDETETEALERIVLELNKALFGPAKFITGLDAKPDSRVITQGVWQVLP